MPDFAVAVVRWILESWPVSRLVRFVSIHITSTTEMTVRRIAVNGFKSHGLPVMLIAIAITVAIQLLIYKVVHKRKSTSHFSARRRMLVRTALNIVLAYLLLLAVIVISGCIEAGGAPFMKSESNGEQYDPDKQPKITGSPLEGKRLLCLGSSITNGNFAKGCSWVDYIDSIYGAKCVKDTLGGTSVADTDDLSYVRRIRKYDDSDHFDLVIIQLSTNDALMGVDVGKSDSTIDLSTFSDALEYLIQYSKETIGCPVLVYSSPRTGTRDDFREKYSVYDQVAGDLCRKGGAYFLDLFNDEDFNDITDEQFHDWMANAFHPMKRGYLEWWLPEFGGVLYEIFGH